MAKILPFHAVMPAKELACRVAALPYDVYNRAEAREAAAKDSLSFLNIDRPETFFAPDYDMYADEVYEKAARELKKQIREGIYQKDEKRCYYLYELTMNNRTQTGIVACASIDDYQNNVIKKHENTREEKERDRIRHVDTCSAQTGPIFLAYRAQEEIARVVAKVKQEEAWVSFTSEDGITHRVFRVAEDADIAAIEEGFASVDSIYIADGHHRAASAVKVGLKRRAEHPDYDGTEEFNTFLSVLFPSDELMIMPYNRVVKDLNGLSCDTFLAAVREKFDVVCKGENPFAPTEKGSFGMYLENSWYELKAKKEILVLDNPVEALDVSLLQNQLLDPILGIIDPRTDKRIDFVGGIRGLSELERRCKSDMKVAFSMYPTSILELFDVSDAGLLMPPKSTWFEPKLRSGLFIHQI